VQLPASPSLSTASRPLGPEVDAAPRPLPARVPLTGRAVHLEPLHRRHAADLFRASAPGTRAGDESWDYLSYGPFETEAAMQAQVAAMASQHDPMAWAVRPVASGAVCGWLTLMDIQPANAAIELGNIWFAPVMQRTRAAREAIFLLLSLAADQLGYRRLVWKCNALNAPSRRAAEVLGFAFEGILRAHYVVKGRRRDTALYAMLDEEWPAARAALQAWLAPENFAADGSARATLGELRARLAGPVAEPGGA
jgi:RimJ/RimL family protein N-acetyltransferase